MKVTFDSRTGRYRGSDGRFIKAEKVESLLDSYRIQRQNKIIDNLNTLNQSNDYDKFLQDTAKELKHLHTVNYIVGKGGVKSMTDNDITVLNGILRDELVTSFDGNSGVAYGLEELVAQAEQGIISKQQFTARIKLYARGARKSYWVGVNERTDQPYMRRFLHGDNNCASCIEYASVGITKKDNLPLPGFNCECHSNCKCTVTYYTATQYKSYMKTQISSFADSVTS